MEWIALLRLLLPLIEMLLKLFSKKDGRMSDRKQLRARLDKCNSAVAGASPGELRKHDRMVKRLEKANARAEEFGI